MTDELKELFDMGLTEDDIRAIIMSEPEGRKPTQLRNNSNLDEVAPERILDEENILDELDLSAYPIVPAGGYNDSSIFCEQFLLHVKEAYDAKGIGTFECVLQFPYGGIGDIEVQAYQRSISSRISRMRTMAKPQPAPFRIVHAQYEILPDRKHVMMRTHRMTEDRYNRWFRDKRKAYAEKTSIDRKLASLL